MKLLVRAADFGYTKTFNDGALKAIEEGIVTTADIMMDTPGSVEGLTRLRNYPWISTGWHDHLWGSPVVGAKNVPSMVNKDGRFKWRKDDNLKDTATYKDCYKEFVAEMKLCIETLGRVPDTALVSNIHHNAYNQAKKDVCMEYGVAINVFAQDMRLYKMNQERAKAKEINASLVESEKQTIVHFDEIFEGGLDCWAADEKWRDRHIVHVENRQPGCLDFQLDIFRESYNLVQNFKQMNTNHDLTIIRGAHPGFLDDYILAESSCTISRVKDCQDFCSAEIKEWVKTNRIELVNYRDALYGTREYQNHLMQIGSELYIPR